MASKWRRHPRTIPPHWLYRPQSRTRLPRDLRWGLGWGLGFATIYSILVAGLALLRGSTSFPRPGARDFTLWTIVAVYFAAGAAGGLLFGLARPLLRRRLGAFFVGGAAGTLAYGGFGLVLRGPTLLTLLGALLLGFGIGGTVAYKEWAPPESDPPAA